MSVSLIRDLSQETLPHPTGVRASLEPGLSGIRAVLFDIYGTLVTSASGDVGLLADGHDREDRMRRALAEERATRIPSRELPLTDHFLALIREDHYARRAEGIDFPEVDIRAIWHRLLDSHGMTVPDVERLAVRYECLVNPVWPMPGSSELLGHLWERGLTLGVISNAQFFTPLLFPALFGRDLAQFHFRDDLTFWSWKLRVAKPSATLFQNAVAALAARGIRPEETLFVGNDMRNDIAPAARVRFGTALFAGDRRSLRLREEDAGAMPEPDLVLTDLSQLPAALA